MQLQYRKTHVYKKIAEASKKMHLEQKYIKIRLLCGATSGMSQCNISQRPLKHHNHMLQHHENEGSTEIDLVRSSSPGRTPIALHLRAHHYSASSSLPTNV